MWLQLFFLEGDKEWQRVTQTLTFIRIISAMLFPQTLVVKDLLIMCLLIFKGRTKYQPT